jgi:hypothetical protein
MEPVTQDFVEQTADFMMHLTKLQLDERVEDYKKRQFNISSLISFESGKHKETNKKDFINRLALTCVHCFESYQVKLPMISINSIKEISKECTKRNEKIAKEYPPEEQDLKSIENINQPYFYAFIENFVSTDKEFQSLFNEGESISICVLLIVLGQVYSKTLERYS